VVESAKTLEISHFLKLAQPVQPDGHWVRMAHQHQLNRKFIMFVTSDTPGRVFAAVFAVALSAVVFATAIIPATPNMGMLA